MGWGCFAECHCAFTPLTCMTPSRVAGGVGVVVGGGVDEGAVAPMRGSVTVVPKPGKWTLAALLAVFLGGGGWY